MTNPLNAGNKVHCGAVKKGAKDKLDRRVLSTPDTSQVSVSGDGPSSCIHSTID